MTFFIDKEKNNNLKAAILAVVLAAVLVLAGSAFIDLVGDIYHFIDNYIWAFFAGLIAFIIACWIVLMMFWLSMVFALFIVYVIVAIVATALPNEGKNND